MLLGCDELKETVMIVNPENGCLIQTINLYDMGNIRALSLFRNQLNMLHIINEGWKIRSFGQGNIFTSICHSFCSQEGGGCLVPGRGVWSLGVSKFFGGECLVLGGSSKFSGGCVSKFVGGCLVPGGSSKFSGGLQIFWGEGFSTGIRSTFGRYTAYSNAFLFDLLVNT